ncbi:hypothetical protein J6590_083114 [Homalodisca vitripennis]|nr:hypothetical protein J6590_083114 [Homalodisca vitripennis]
MKSAGHWLAQSISMGNHTIAKAVCCEILHTASDTMAKECALSKSFDETIRSREIWRVTKRIKLHKVCKVEYVDGSDLKCVGGCGHMVHGSRVKSDRQKQLRSKKD